MTIQEKARFVRSKNAGPFWVTMDIFAESGENYKAIAESPNLNRENLSRYLNVPPETIKIFLMKDLNVVKISIPRNTPQGAKYERDMHGGQQYIPLLDVEL